MPINLAELFERFIIDKRYMCNLSPRTLEMYREAFGRYKRFAPVLDELPNDEIVREFVIQMRSAPTISPTTCNITIRSLNSFLSWIAEQGYGPKITIPKLRLPQKIMPTFSENDLQHILDVKPDRPPLYRAYAILCTLVDCGLRISEVLSMRKDAIDWTNLLLKVSGKGKDRIVPMSVSLRKTLWAYESRYRKAKFESPYFFCTRDGLQLRYRNIRRDFEELFIKAGFDKSQIAGFFHAFRRFFARYYLKRGGNLIYLQSVLGHTNVATTKMYVEVNAEELRQQHLAISPLDRLKKKS